MSTIATVASARDKYTRKTGPGGPGAANYNAAKARMPGAWVEGMSRFGMAPGPNSQQAYQSGIAAAQYRGGDPAKWEQNMRASLSR